MNKTEHYKLNQWDPEDRLLRVDFNADNAAIESAMKANADAIAAEGSDRAAADTAIRGEMAAAVQDAKNTAAAAMTAEQNARAGEDAAIRGELANEANTRYGQDIAIRQEFAAADAAVAAQNCMVKLYETTTTYTAAQIDLNVAGLNLTAYKEIIIYPEIAFASSANRGIYVRINGLANSVYTSSSARAYLTMISPYAGHSNATSNTISVLHLSLCVNQTAAYVNEFGTNGFSYSGGGLPASTLAPSAITSINFVESTGSANLAAGAKFTIYGVR